MTLSRVDPALLPVLDLFPKIDLSAETLADARRAIAGIAATWAAAPLPEGLERIELHVPGPTDAGVRIIVYRAAVPGALPAVLHIHGGGYVMGTPEMDELSNRSLALELNCVVVAVDYRLAPETPFPGGLEDCYSVLLWLSQHADELNIDSQRIAVMGQSAGGGVAAVLCMLARERGEVSIAFQLLIAPMLDDRTGMDCDPPVSGEELVWSRGANRFGWASLLGGAQSDASTTSQAAAARAGSLRNLPPAFIMVGALDLFADEDIEYARRLIAADVPVELHVIPAAFHGFELGAVLDVGISQKAVGLARDALRRAFTRTDSRTST
jgi:acetyl esterase/lipase